MISTRRALSGLLVMALGAVVFAVPTMARADVSPADVEAARERVRQVTGELEGKVEALDESRLRESELRDRLDRLVVDLTARERELVAARRAARDRVAFMYMNAGSDQARAAFAVGDITEAPARLVYLDTVAASDREVVIRLEAARRDYDRQRALLDETVAAEESARSESEALVAEVYGRLEEVNAEYQAIKAEWEAQEAERIRREEEERARLEAEAAAAAAAATSTTTVAVTSPATSTTAGTTTSGGDGGSPGTTSVATTIPGTTVPDTSTTVPVTSTVPVTTTTVAAVEPGVMVCPVDGATTFRDDWGEARPEGRGHAGTDLLAATGTPLVAIESGVIFYPNWHYAGGIGLYLDGDSGARWYYAHMDGYAPGIEGGVRVQAGQLVGYVGSTGNASTPHLHLGYIPDAGVWVYANPYPIVAGLC